MSANYQERAKREKAAYDKPLGREVYDKVFRHCGFQNEKRRAGFLRKAFSEIEISDALEIGSSTWSTWLPHLRKHHSDDINFTCINISERELQRGKSKVWEGGPVPVFKIMDAHRLEFSDNSFDVIFGSGILHHLEFEIVISEIKRVLRPGGIMIFYEPLDINPVGWLVRKVTPKARTVDERPLRYKELHILKENFSCRFEYEQFFSVPFGVLSGFLFENPSNFLTKSAFYIESKLLEIFPFLGPLFRYVLIFGRNKGDPDTKYNM